MAICLALGIGASFYAFFGGLGPWIFSAWLGLSGLFYLLLFINYLASILIIFAVAKIIVTGILSA